MQRIDVTGERGRYGVLVGCGILPRIREILREAGISVPRAMVSNTTVGPFWGRDVGSELGIGCSFELPDGEVHKRWAQVEEACARWLAGGVRRPDLVLALGGGVVTDTVGFAAAVYMRGIDWVAVPTTLLAMVDAAVGGKTGVNLDEGKNLVGAFWSPRLVVADVDVLATLPGRELRAGVVEAVKTAWIGDRDLLAVVDRRIGGYDDLPAGRWQELVARAVAVKATVVAADERERGARKALNLGHTIGHALEAVTGYSRFLHGEAVAWGLRAAVLLARRRGLLGDDGADRLRTALRRAGPYPPIDDLEPARVLEHLARDKKSDDLGVAWVLPTDDGVILDQRVTALEVIGALEALRQTARG